MIAGGNEKLLAFDFVIALICGRRRRRQIRERRARLRFGERHGALPFARGHFGQVGIFHFLRAVGRNQAGRAVRQTMINGGGIVGRAENRRRQHNADGKRQLLTAQIIGESRGNPAAFTRRAHDLPDPGMNPDFAAHIFRRLTVHFLEKGFEELFPHSHGCIQQHVEDFSAVVGKIGVFEQCFDVV